jgi:hypothetical protein
LRLSPLHPYLLQAEGVERLIASCDPALPVGAENAELKVGDLAETVTVSGQSPVVDIQNVHQVR